MSVTKSKSTVTLSEIASKLEKKKDEVSKNKYLNIPSRHISFSLNENVAIPNNTDPKPNNNNNDNYNNEGKNACSVLDSFSPTSVIQTSPMYRPPITSSTSIGALDDFERDVRPTAVSKQSMTPFTYVDVKISTKQSKANKAGNKTLKSQGDKTKEEGWQEVSRKFNKLLVPGKSVSRLIGRAGCNINAIREFTKATIDLNKIKNSPDSQAILRGSQDAILLASKFIDMFIEDPDADVDRLISCYKATTFVSKPNSPLTSSKNPPIPSMPSSSSSSSHENILIGKTLYSSSNPWKQVESSNVGPVLNSFQENVSFDINYSSSSSKYTPTSNDLFNSENFTGDAAAVGVINQMNYASSETGNHSDLNPTTERQEDSFEKKEVVSNGCYDNDLMDGLDASPHSEQFELNDGVSRSVEFNDPFGGKMMSSDQKIVPDNSVMLSSSSSATNHLGSNEASVVQSSASRHADLEGTAVYSPFNNRFSTFMHARSKESKKDFASVAASSSAENTSSFLAQAVLNFPCSSFLTVHSSASPTTQSIDSALQAKAPGFRPAGFTPQPKSPTKLNLDSIALDHNFFPFPHREDDKEFNHLNTKPTLNLPENFNSPESMIGYGSKMNLMPKNFMHESMIGVHEGPISNSIKLPLPGLNPDAPKFTSSFSHSNLFDPTPYSFHQQFNPQNNLNYPNFGIPANTTHPSNSYIRASNYNANPHPNPNPMRIERPNMHPSNGLPPAFIPASVTPQDIFPHHPYQQFDNVASREAYNHFQKPFEHSLPPKLDKSHFSHAQNTVHRDHSLTNASINETRLPIWQQQRSPTSK